jgi:hypothetical protein
VTFHEAKKARVQIRVSFAKILAKHLIYTSL